MNKKQAMTAALSKLGYNARMVSIRERPCTYSWAYTVTIRDPKVNYRKVKQAVSSFEEQRYCEASGEPLLGANTYVDVEIADGVQKVWGEQYAQMIIEAYNSLKETPLGDQEWRKLFQLDNFQIRISKERGNYEVTLCEDKGEFLDITKRFHLSDLEKSRTRDPKWFERYGEESLKSQALEIGVGIYLHTEKEEEATPEPQKEKAVNVDGIDAVEGVFVTLHSGGKSYLIEGNTKPIKEGLKLLPKCSWNGVLKCWVIAKTSADENRAALEKLGAIFK